MIFLVLWINGGEWIIIKVFETMTNIFQNFNLFIEIFQLSNLVTKVFLTMIKIFNCQNNCGDWTTFDWTIKKIWVVIKIVLNNDRITISRTDWKFGSPNFTTKNLRTKCFGQHPKEFKQWPKFFNCWINGGNQTTIN